MRTLIYARYSSQLQDARSIGDQLAACRDRAAAEGWEIVDVFFDAAISGAAGIEQTQRPGLHKLLARVEAGGINQVLVDSTSRIARDIGDAHHVRKRIVYAGARLYSLADGEIDALKGTIKGLLDEQQRVDLAHNIRRGQRGRITQGRAAGSLAYGYRRVPKLDERGELVRGLREIDPDQAETIRRIYREYAAGRSALAIVTGLNGDGIAAPRGGSWRVGTLLGNRAMSVSILCNPTYTGRLLYGRTRKVQDPRTRVSKMKKSAGPVHEGEAPHLRIVDDALFQAVQDQLERRATTRPERQRRPKHILSGLGWCGCCGGVWSIVAKARWGCSAAAGGSACANRRTITSGEYERRVLADLKADMLAPDVVSAYVKAYHEERARAAADVTRERDRVERRLAEAKRKVGRLIAVVADGGSEFAEIRGMLVTARDERDRLAAELAGLEALPVVTLHPGLVERYRAEIEDLERALSDEATRLEAVPRLRELIERVDLTPAEQAGVSIILTRRIDRTLAMIAPELERAAGRV